MRIFIDESGDLGFGRSGSSRYFVVTAVVLNDENHQKIQTSVKRLTRHLNKSKKTRLQELKATSLPLHAKIKLWHKIEDVDFRIHAVAINKSRVYRSLQEVPGRLYNFVTRLVVDGVSFGSSCSRDSIVVEIDKSKGTNAQVDFNRYLSSHIESRVAPQRPLAIRHVPSECSPGIQLADVFGWGIFRKYDKEDLEWYQHFQGKIKSEVDYLEQQ